MNLETPDRLRVFVADDHPLILDGIKALVSADPALELVGEARDGLTALRLAMELKPAVAVLDLSMPGLNGIEVSRRLLAACPECRILILTVHEDDGYLRKLLSLGVAGYILKRSAPEELRRGIHAVSSGHVYLDPAIAARAIGRNAPRLPAASLAGAIAELSAREVDVLRLAAIGHSNKVIAAMLEIRVKSVDTYKARAMDKLGFKSRVEMIRFAASKGWLEYIEANPPPVLPRARS
jgi:DNA-binding NarL/FixJ family response regulator